MRPFSRSFFVPGVVVAAAVVLIVCPSRAQDSTSVADQLTNALNLYNNVKLDEAQALASDILQRADLDARDSIGVLSVLSAVAFAQGEKHMSEAFGYLKQIADVDPCLLHLPDRLWNERLRQKWFELASSVDAITCSEETTSGIKTIAIMQFDNFSIGEYQEKLGLLSKGLADFFEHDFGKISDLRVVERDRIDYVLKEHELVKSGAIDRATAVKAGKILGAQLMVFGSITQIDKKSARMIVRAVNVETSEIVASVDKEGKPNFAKMERELVGDLAKKLDITFGDDIKNIIEASGTESMDAMEFYSMGVDYADKFDFANAYKFFKKAYEVDGKLEEAKRRMDIYYPIVG
ncbi:MAG: CsgG/HfaB family protein [Candidatus Zixiibacteriota bacterium]